MKITISRNREVVTLPGEGQLLLSYGRPVAAKIDGKAYRVFSETTARHVRTWLGGAQADLMPQEWFDELAAKYAKEEDRAETTEAGR